MKIFTEEELNTLTNGELTAHWNELTNSALKKFDSKQKGVDRILAHYDKIGADPGSITEYDEVARSPDDEVMEEPAKKKASGGEKGKKKNVTKDSSSGKIKQQRGRIRKTLELLREDDYSIQGLMEKLDTTYKNITGDLYIIRHGLAPGLSDDEELISHRSGKTMLYGVVLKDDENSTED